MINSSRRKCNLSLIKNIEIKITMRLIINKTNQIGSLIMFSKLVLILIITYHIFLGLSSIT